MLSRWQFDLLLNGWAIAYKGWSLKREWSEHIARTKLFLLETLTGGEELHVLGAGRLLDFPLLEILNRYQKIHLYDGDPGAIRYLRKLQVDKDKITVHSVELTGALLRFRSNLDSATLVKDIFLGPEFKQFAATPSVIACSNQSHLVSLNLLSQLPLAYLEIFERWIRNKYGIKYLREEERSWLDEYNKLAIEIIRAHLDILNSSGASKVVLISDTEQLFYPFRLKQLPLPEEARFSWQIASHFHHSLEVTSTTCELDLKESLDKYNVVSSNLWPWHLAPATKRQDGIICRVEAIEFDRPPN